MKKLLFCCALAALSWGCGPAGEGKETIRVAVAANVQFAMEELKAAFEAEHGIPMEIAISSSGKLTAQIQQGAPYDILVSADMKYPEALVNSGKAVGPPRVYAYGALVLWTLTELEPEAGPGFLLQEQVGKIAIANPRNAPYGEQALRYFDYYGIGGQVAPKLVYGESIAQTNQYILTRAADVGLTAKSVVLSPEMKGKGRWIELPAETYEPIAQGAVITGYGRENHPEGSRLFLDFLFSPGAREIFRRYGYVLPEG